MHREFEIQSLRVEKYVSKIDDGIFKENERYILNCLENDKKFEVILYTKFKKNSENKIISCGNIEIKKIKRFSGITYFPTKKLMFSLEDDKKNIKNDIFYVNKEEILNTEIRKKSVKLNFDYFKETIRKKEKRPVWIITGNNCLGKTYLTSMICNYSNLTKYETDVSKQLPEVFTEDIIVIGKKYKFNINDIISRIYGEFECILVNFEKLIPKDNII